MCVATLGRQKLPALLLIGEGVLLALQAARLENADAEAAALAPPPVLDLRLEAQFLEMDTQLSPGGSARLRASLSWIVGWAWLAVPFRKRGKRGDAMSRALCQPSDNNASTSSASAASAPGA